MLSFLLNLSAFGIFFCIRRLLINIRWFGANQMWMVWLSLCVVNGILMWSGFVRRWGRWAWASRRRRVQLRWSNGLVRVRLRRAVCSVIIEHVTLWCSFLNAEGALGSGLCA